VNKFFSRHSPNWRGVQYLHSPSQKTTGQKYRNGKRDLDLKRKRARLESEFVFLLANPEFNSHLATCDNLSAPLV
jgi:hypothetical protein